MKTIKLLMSTMTAIAVMGDISANANLTLNSPGVVGILNGLAGDNPGTDAIVFAQHLLDMAAGTVDSTFDAHTYETSSTEYAATLSVVGTLTGGVGVTSVPVGYDYAIAKYDGQNAGWVLFALSGLATNLPEYPADLWTTKPEQYGISHYTAFKSGTTTVVPEPSTYIAGALAVIPLLLGLRRKISRR